MVVEKQLEDDEDWEKLEDGEDWREIGNDDDNWGDEENEDWNELEEDSMDDENGEWLEEVFGYEE